MNATSSLYESGVDAYFHYKQIKNIYMSIDYPY